jgi:hypothetical protein
MTPLQTACYELDLRIEAVRAAPELAQHRLREWLSDRKPTKEQSA